MSEYGEFLQVNNLFGPKEGLLSRASGAKLLVFHYNDPNSPRYILIKDFRTMGNIWACQAERAFASLMEDEDFFYYPHELGFRGLDKVGVLARFAKVIPKLLHDPLFPQLAIPYEYYREAKQLTDGRTPNSEIPDSVHRVAWGTYINMLKDLKLKHQRTVDSQSDDILVDATVSEDRHTNFFLYKVDNPAVMCTEENDRAISRQIVDTILELYPDNVFPERDGLRRLKKGTVTIEALWEAYRDCISRVDDSSEDMYSWASRLRPGKTFP